MPKLQVNPTYLLRLFFSILFLLLSETAYSHGIATTKFLQKFTKQDTTKYNQLIESLKILHTFKESQKDSLLTLVDLALNQTEQQQDTLYSAKLHSLKGNIFLYGYEKDEDALQSFYKSLELSEKSKDTLTIINASIGLGVLNIRLKLHDKALGFLNNALDLAYATNNTMSIVSCTINISAVYDRLNEAEKKLYYYKKIDSLLSVSKEAEVNNMIRIYLADGLVEGYMLANQVQKTLPVAERTLKLLEDTTLSDLDRLGVLYLAGNVYYQNKMYATAETYLLQSYELAYRVKEIYSIRDTSELLTALYEAKNSYENAFFYAKQTILANEKIYDDTVAKQVSELNEKYESEKKDKEIAQQNIEIERNKNRYSQLVIISSIVLLILLSVLLVRTFKSNRYKQKLNGLLKRRNKELQLSIEKRKKLEQKVENIQNEISKDLHDNFGNRFLGIETSHNVLKELSEADKFNSADFDKFSKHLDVSLDGLRSDIKDLIWINNTENNRWFKVLERLAKIVLSFAEANDKFIAFTDNSEQDFETPKYFNRQLLLIVKEIINNACKHAKASKIEVKIASDKTGTINISCIDDGIGFDVNNLPRINGLDNIKQRAISISCQLEIHSKLNKGTTVTLSGNIKS